MKQGLLAALALALASGVAIHAQQRPAPGPFATLKGLSCAFTTVANAEWVDGAPKVTTIPNGFSFSIANLDLRRGRARVVGSNGATAEATLVLTGTSLNIFERTPIGNFNLTSIFAAGGTGGKVLAVFSQHLGDTTAVPTAAQAYGSCESAS